MNLLPSLGNDIESALGAFTGDDQPVRHALSRFRKALLLAKVCLLEFCI